MKFIIDPKILKKELAFVQGVVERKNTLPILANILIQSTSKHAIRINGTDLDVTIRVDADAESIEEQGSMCVQARKLFDIARLLPDAAVSFEKQENDWVSVQCGKSTFKLPGVATDTFPELPSAKKMPFAISSSVLRQLISKTIFAITVEEGRYTLSGAKFEIRGDLLRIVTTDGHRLALIEVKGEIKNPDNTEVDLLIPRKTLAELTKLASDFDGDISFGADDNHVYFQAGSRELTSRILSGQFPNYEMVLPKNNDQSVTLNTDVFGKALKRVSLMADERSHAVTLTLQKEKLVISSHNMDQGEADEIVETNFQGNEIAIGFNSQYIQDFLNSVDTENIVLEFKDANSQAEFKPATTDYERALCVIMPMRI